MQPVAWVLVLFNLRMGVVGSPPMVSCSRFLMAKSNLGVAVPIWNKLLKDAWCQWGKGSTVSGWHPGKFLHSHISVFHTGGFVCILSTKLDSCAVPTSTFTCRQKYLFCSFCWDLGGNVGQNLISLRRLNLLWFHLLTVYLVLYMTKFSFFLFFLR